jgi:hypothetical protein
MTDGNEALELTQETNVYNTDSSHVENTAATMFTLYLPKFQLMVNKLSNKALRRVLKALVEYPLVEEEYNFSSQSEKDTFFIAEQLILAKLMMIQQTMLNHPEMLQEPKASDILETQTEVINNG